MPDDHSNPPSTVVDVDKLTNPYAGDSNVTPVYGDVTDADVKFIQCFCVHGAKAAVIGTLWKKLCYELRLRGITDFSRQDDFEWFVTHCHIVPDDEYISMRDDAAKWQAHLVGAGGTNRGGLPHGPIGGTMSKPTPPIRGSHSTTSHADEAGQTKPSDVQKRGRKSGKGGSGEA